MLVQDWLSRGLLRLGSRGDPDPIAARGLGRTGARTGGDQQSLIFLPRRVRGAPDARRDGPFWIPHPPPPSLPRGAPLPPPPAPPVFPCPSQSHNNPVPAIAARQVS